MLWVGTISVCAVVAASLQVMGPLPDGEARTSVSTPRPVTRRPRAASLAMAMAEARPQSSESLATPTEPPSPPQAPFVPAVGPPVAGADPEIVASAESELPSTVHLRVARAPRKCHRAACRASAWKVLNHGDANLPRHAKLKLHGLRLAPTLREAAERGEIDLLIDAKPEQRTVHGRKVLEFVATQLTGVTPHSE